MRLHIAESIDYYPLPFKGRIRVGMGCGVIFISICYGYLSCVFHSSPITYYRAQEIAIFYFKLPLDATRIIPAPIAKL